VASPHQNLVEVSSVSIVYLLDREKGGGYIVTFSIDMNALRASDRSSSGIYCNSQVELGLERYIPVK
jgi:hypothetical protein